RGGDDPDRAGPHHRPPAWEAGMDRDARAPARPPFGTPQTRPKAASGAAHRAESAAAVKPRVNCHRNPKLLTVVGPFAHVRATVWVGRVRRGGGNDVVQYLRHRQILSGSSEQDAPQSSHAFSRAAITRSRVRGRSRRRAPRAWATALPIAAIVG